VHDPGVDLRQTVPGGLSRVRSARRLLNECPFPRGEHHDLADPPAAFATLRWETGDEEISTVVLEWWHTRAAGWMARVRVTDPRLMTGAVWIPAADVRPR
jgi:hypothetical protein